MDQHSQISLPLVVVAVVVSNAAGNAGGSGGGAGGGGGANRPGGSATSNQGYDIQEDLQTVLVLVDLVPLVVVEQVVVVDLLLVLLVVFSMVEMVCWSLLVAHLVTSWWWRWRWWGAQLSPDAGDAGTALWWWWCWWWSRHIMPLVMMELEALVVVEEVPLRDIPTLLARRWWWWFWYCHHYISHLINNQRIAIILNI